MALGRMNKLSIALDNTVIYHISFDMVVMVTLRAFGHFTCSGWYQQLTINKSAADT